MPHASEGSRTPAEEECDIPYLQHGGMDQPAAASFSKGSNPDRSAAFMKETQLEVPRHGYLITLQCDQARQLSQHGSISPCQAIRLVICFVCICKSGTALSNTQHYGDHECTHNAVIM